MRGFWGWLIALIIGAIAVVAGVIGWNSFRPHAEASTPRHYIIALAPNYDPDARTAALHAVVDFLARDMPEGSSFAVFDAWNMREISRGDIPNHPGYARQPSSEALSAARLRLLERERGEIRQFITHPQGSDVNLHPGAIDPAKFLLDVGRYHLRANAINHVVLLGDPIFHDDRIPEYSFRDGFFPSDGHLAVSSQLSIFGTQGKETLLQGVAVHMGWTVSPQWFDDSHREAIYRFWSLYVSSLGGNLVTFHADPALTLAQAGTGRPVARDMFQVAANSTKVEMVAIRRRELDASIVELLFEDSDAIRARYDQQAPLRNRGGRVRIGIAWECQDCDIDLYVASSPRDQDELYFARRRSDIGQFFKDFAAQDLVPAPIHGYEYVELENVSDVRAVTASINFYSGTSSGGVRGTLRAEFEGRVFASEFFVPASEGNLGVDRDDDRRSSRYWDIRQIGEFLPAQ